MEVNGQNLQIDITDDIQIFVEFCKSKVADGGQAEVEIIAACNEIGGVNLKTSLSSGSETISVLHDTQTTRWSLEELHAKVDELPKIILESHEDTVPRLFFIFPEDGVWESPVDSLFTKQYRLYFLCEHEIVEHGKVKKQFHLAYHAGYPVVRPREFVAQFGSYVHYYTELSLTASNLAYTNRLCLAYYWLFA
ncbi:hypothetical protein BC937DRAFT_91592 [Endogone sp. FLAS-F59071]|nr:hypothetical protein BC937DRAFT_91592 [Endogone sp. FLAS-F59071]|eukprot:RUS16121.1 hypothetical protein BC937DRAFT_91592 [Endogone sp. FLAS-F59071]